MCPPADERAAYARLSERPSVPPVFPLRGSAMPAPVRVGLRRPCTFVVLAVLILSSGPLAVLRSRPMLIPGIGVVWNCTGPLPDPMAGRISSLFERVLSTAVNDVEHIGAGPPQTNIVHVGGKRPALLTVLKNGSASSVASSRRAALPGRLRTDRIGDKSRSSCARRSAVRRAKTASRRRSRA